MQRGSQRHQRLALRRLARQIRQQDPDLARLLSGGGRGPVPPFRFTSVPTACYAAVGGMLLLAGMVLGVGSAAFWGVVGIGAAVVRHRTRPHPTLAPGRSRTPHDRRETL